MANAVPPFRVPPLEWLMNQAMWYVKTYQPDEVERRQLRVHDDEAVIGFWESIESALLFALIVYAVSLGFFELVLRRPFWWLYSSRNGHPAYKSSTPPTPRVPFSWIWMLMGEAIDTDEVIFERWGTDALVMLHMQRLFIRVLGFASLFGCCVLLPVYYFADEPDDDFRMPFFGFHKTTLSKILEPGPRLWAPVVGSYAMTFYSMFLLNQFYKNFCTWRFRHLVTTASAFTVANKHTAMQESLTVMVENIPDNLQHSEKLQRHFDKLFPGQVHSAVVMLRNTGTLTKLVNRYRRLELMIDEMIIQQAKLQGNGQHVRQCKWRCGQPQQCLFCCIGHPGRCLVLPDTRLLNACFAPSEPVLKQALAETKAAILTTFRERVESMERELARDRDEDLDVSSEGSGRSSRASSLVRSMSISSIGDVEWVGDLIPMSLKGVVFDEESTDAQYRLANLRDKGIERWLAEVGRAMNAKRERSERVTKDAPEFATISLREGAGDPESGEYRPSDVLPRESRLTTTGEVLGGMSTASVRDLEQVGLSSGAYTRRGQGAGVYDGTGGEGVFSKDHDLDEPQVGRFSVEALRKSFLATNPLVSLCQSVCNIGKFFVRLFRVFFEGLAELFMSIGQVLNDLLFGAGSSMERVGTGFVTFKSHVARSNAVKAQLFRAPFAMCCLPAPEVRDVIFENVATPNRRIQNRIAFTKGLLFLGALWWSALTVFITGLPEILNQVIDDDEPKDSMWYRSLTEHMPVLLLLLLLNVLPLMFVLTARYYEGRKSISEVDLSVVRRYHDYLMANLYVTLMAATVIESAHQAVQESLTDPIRIIALIGANIAYSGSFFMNFVIIQAGLSPLWLWRIWPLISRGWFEPAQPVEVPSVPYGWAIPKQLMLLVIAMTYWTIAPLILPVVLFLFVSNNIWFRFLIVWSHMPHYETGGRFWYSTFKRIIFGLAMSAVFTFFAIWLKGGIDHSFALLPLPFIVMGFGEYCRVAYEVPSRDMARADAVDHDHLVAELEKQESAGGVVVTDGFSKYLYAQPAITRALVFDKLDRRTAKKAQDGSHDGGAEDIRGSSFSNPGYVPETTTYQPMHLAAAQAAAQHDAKQGTAGAQWHTEEEGYVPTMLSSQVTDLDSLDAPTVEMSES